MAREKHKEAKMSTKRSFDHLPSRRTFINVTMEDILSQASTSPPSLHKFKLHFSGLKQLIMKRIIFHIWASMLLNTHTHNGKMLFA